jgi:hypothetical protein
MKSPKLLMLLALGSVGVPMAMAAPSTQVGDCFVNVTYQVSPGSADEQMTYAYLYYLAADGTCKQIYYKATGLGLYAYGPTLDGTYTYVPTSGNPNEAQLIFNFPKSTQYNGYTLEFTSDTEGSVNQGPGSIGSGTFSILLATPNSFLINVSNRVTLRPADTAITGFVVGGTANRLVLVRAVGPGLAQFGVSPVSSNPALNLFSGSTLAASGQPWSAVSGYDAEAMNLIFSLAGAFSLQSGSSDVAYFGSLSPGAYTAQVHDPTAGTSGATALVEVYILPYPG